MKYIYCYVLSFLLLSTAVSAHTHPVDHIYTPLHVIDLFLLVSVLAFIFLFLNITSKAKK